MTDKSVTSLDVHEDPDTDTERHRWLLSVTDKAEASSAVHEDPDIIIIDRWLLSVTDKAEVSSAVH